MKVWVLVFLTWASDGSITAEFGWDYFATESQCISRAVIRTKDEVVEWKGTGLYRNPETKPAPSGVYLCVPND